MTNDKVPALAEEAVKAAAGGVARAREAYERYAQAGEGALNAYESAMSQAFEDWRQVMGTSREAAAQLSDSNVAGSRRMREQWEGAAARLYNAYEDNAGRMLAAMREVGHRMLVASDTNIRASLDFAERLSQAKGASEIVALQGAFLQEQAHRLTEQMVDLQRTTTRLAREAGERADRS